MWIIITLIIIFIIAFAISKYINREKVIRDSNSTYYYKNRKLHRKDGPAIEWPYRNKKYWLKNGEFHRIDGPSIINNDHFPQFSYVKYHIEDNELLKEEFNNWILRIRILSNKC